MKRVIVILLFALGLVYGVTAFNLVGIKACDILIINKPKELKPLKKEIKEMMLETSKDLEL